MFCCDLKICCIRLVAGAMLAAVVVTALAGCGSTQRASAPQIEQRLMSEFQTWRNTPYQWGGISRTGVDCSGFIQAIYRDALGIDLPRTTDSQMRAGSRVSPKRLQVGDLVFFRTGRRTFHAGIVLSNGRMMHASTSNGVEITNLNSSYWRRTFIGARRIL
jgi:cell wall-associated NlpC family hydrolase